MLIHLPLLYFYMTSSGSYPSLLLACAWANIASLGWKHFASIYIMAGPDRRKLKNMAHA